jgi:hypothetical protein
MRFFGGLTAEETAEALGVSPTTVMRDWRLARAWLTRELGAWVTFQVRGFGSSSRRAKGSGGFEVPGSLLYQPTD